MGEVSPLNRLYAEYREKGFEFFTVYVREPHPGEHYGHHTSWKQKFQYARDCREQDGIENRLLIDDLEGTVHRLYGIMPNMVYIIDREGKVAYKAMWTDHKEIEGVLNDLVLADQLRSQGQRLKTSYSERVSYIPAEYSTEVRDNVFGRAGQKAWQDYRKAFHRS